MTCRLSREKRVIRFETLRWCIPIFSFHPELSKGKSVLTNNRCWCKVQSNVVDRSHCSWLLVVVDVDVNIYVAGYVDVDVYIDECPWGCVTLLLTSFPTSFLCCRNDLWALNLTQTNFKIIITPMCDPTNKGVLYLKASEYTDSQ